jgi:hypothetical protein
VQWVVGVAGSLIAAVLAFAATRAFDRAQRLHRVGHLRYLRRGEGVQIVIPDFQIDSFQIQGFNVVAKIPPNVRVMPMAEGEAIADIVREFRGIGEQRLTLCPQETFKDDYSLTICVGGPSVNAVTRQVLETTFPEFHLAYPQHTAVYRSVTFAPRTDDHGSLLEDYGFVASTKTPNGNQFILIFGVWAPGTRIAARTFIHGIGRRSEAFHAIKEGRTFMLAAHAELHGLRQGDAHVVGFWDASLAYG